MQWNDMLHNMNHSLRPGGTIALLGNPGHQALREKISGVYSAATRCGWQVHRRQDQSRSAGEPAAVDGNYRAVDVGRGGRAQEHARAGDVARLAPAPGGYAL